MPRTSRPDAAAVWRAVVNTIITDADGNVTSSYTSAYGPYDRRADASRTLTRESHPARSRGFGTVTRSGHLETSPLVWLEVETKTHG